MASMAGDIIEVAKLLEAIKEKWQRAPVRKEHLMRLLEDCERNLGILRNNIDPDGTDSTRLVNSYGDVMHRINAQIPSTRPGLMGIARSTWARISYSTEEHGELDNECSRLSQALSSIQVLITLEDDSLK